VKAGEKGDNNMDKIDKAKILSLSPQAIREHYRSGYQHNHWLQNEYHSDFIHIEMGDYYHELRHALTILLQRKKIIDTAVPLEQLHQYIDADLIAYGNDGLGKLGTFFYEDNAGFVEILRSFIHHIVFKKIIKKPFFFQATPTFRVHCPGALNAEFFPHYHTDLALGHSPREMNFWIPLTPIVEGHGFYLATLESSRRLAGFVDYDLLSLMDDKIFRDKKYLTFCAEKFDPVKMEAGNALMFDGRCFHTAMPVSSHTRISVDFRIVLLEDFDRGEFIYQNHGRRKQMMMLPDEYYYRLDASEIGR
jgi:hypothetical protein